LVAQRITLRSSRAKFFSFLLAGLALAMSGCAKHTRSDVAMRMIIPPTAQRMELPEDHVFLMAEPIREELPEYPSGIARTEGSVTAVCVEIVVDEDGAVEDVFLLNDVPDCPESGKEVDPRYAKAAISAVSGWEFFAAATCYFPPGSTRTDDCSGPGVVITNVPVKMAFVFTFQQENGRPVVRARRA